MTKSNWYKLDNAGKVFPAIRSARFTSLFRLSADLTMEIDPQKLQDALVSVLRRFPTIRTCLRRGVFWYYLQENRNIPVIEPDGKYPCLPIDFKKNNDYMFRIRYCGRRLAMEMFHSLTDGGGGFVFFKTLIAQYLKREGIEIPCGEGVFDVDAEPEPEELEDAYRRFANLAITRGRMESQAWQINGETRRWHQVRLLTGIMPGDAVSKLAKERKVSTTEFLNALYIYSLQTYQQQSDPYAKLPIRASIPLDLRYFYPTKSLRNFTLTVNVGIDLSYGAYSFDEILHEVHHQFRLGLNPRYLNAAMSANIKTEQNPVVRALPLFLKRIALRVAANMVARDQTTSTLSNLGIIKLPEEMTKYVTRIDTVMGIPQYNHLNASSVCYNNKLVINFTGDLIKADVERVFFTKLVEMGVPVEIDCNITGEGDFA